MTKLLFSGVITTAAQLVEQFLDHFKVIEDIYGEWLMDIELWNQLILSKTEPGVYHMMHSINVPVYFPHSCGQDLPIQCIALDRTHLRNTQTTDATRPAWHYAKVEIRIDPAGTWELSDDISILKNPPGLCHVTLRVFDMLFNRFIDVEAERHKFDKTMTVFNAHIGSKADIQNFLNDPGFKMKYLHTIKKDVGPAIWHDLVTAPHRRNSFAVKLPYLLRIIPEDAGDRSRIPTGISVLAVKDDVLATLGFPLATASTGLFSATINLILMHPQSRIIPITKDLWPDIPANLADFTTPPNCRIGLYLSDVRFVSMADDKELHGMVGRRAWKIW
jgi:hypothetical protein